METGVVILPTCLAVPVRSLKQRERALECQAAVR